MLRSLLVAGAVALALAAAGGLLTEIGPWYRQLRKPSWQPPDWLFGPAWTLILGLAAWSAASAWVAAPTAGERVLVVVLYSLNALFHLLWSPLFFKYKRPDWALLEVPLLWLSILAPMVLVAPFSPLASWLLLPYLLWVAFAAYLNLTIVRLNRPFSVR
ncbi:MAG: TspO/MBR family protein [Acetobacteraceae bacterium]|nr:TspO/MBR family protein [Acetobacteraceae bacterium]